MPFVDKKKKKIDADTLVNNVNSVVTANNTTQEAPVVEKPEKVVKKVKASAPVTAVDLLNPSVDKVQKSEAIYLRCRPDIKAKFKALCKQKKISESAMFEFWVESLLK